MLACVGVNQLLSVGAANPALPGDASVRPVSRLAIRQQTFRRQHGGHHGRRPTQLAGALPRDPRKGSSSLVPFISHFAIRNLGHWLQHLSCSA